LEGECIGRVWTPAIELENAVYVREASVRYGRNMVVQIYGDGRVKVRGVGLL